MLSSAGGALLISLVAAVVAGDSITNTRRAAASDMCSLLSLSEVEQALGRKVGKPTLIPPQPTSPGGCAYMTTAGAGTLTLMVFEVPDAADFYASMVHGMTETNHVKEQAVPGLGTKAVHLPDNFLVLIGKKVLTFTYSGAPRTKVEGLVRKLVAQL